MREAAGAQAGGSTQPLRRPRNLALIESIDCTKLASKFNTLLEEQKRTVAVYVQVNTSGEDSKSGCPPEEAVQLCKFVHNECPALKLSGYARGAGEDCRPCSPITQAHDHWKTWQ